MFTAGLASAALGSAFASALASVLASGLASSLASGLLSGLDLSNSSGAAKGRRRPSGSGQQLTRESDRKSVV